MSASASKAILVGLLVASCGEPAEYRYGTNVSGLLFEPYGPTEGVHPDKTVLIDPANPFANAPFGPVSKWKILEGGGSVAGFYAFATMLVREPIGENQYFAAQALSDIARTNSLKDPSQRDAVTAMAIAGFQSVLDHFPESRGYDPTGTTSYRLATPAYKAILALGGKVDGDWVLLKTADGEEAVRASEIVGEVTP